MVTLKNSHMLKIHMQVSVDKMKSCLGDICFRKLQDRRTHTQMGNKTKLTNF